MAVKLVIYSVIVLGLFLAGVASVTSHATDDAVPFPSGPDDDVRSLIDQLRAGFQQELADLKKEIADMRTKHGLEIEKQRVQFQDQLSSIRKECGEVRGYQPKHGHSDVHVDDAETDMLADNPSIAIDPPRQLNGSYTAHALLKSPGKLKARKRSLPGQKRRGTTSPNVAFFARLATTMHALGAGQHVRFDNVVTNVGNGYDKQIGVFRAPVSGTYLIAMTITTAVRDNGHFGIYINQNQLTWSNVAGNDNIFDETSQTVIVHLDVGDDVTVRATDGNHGAWGANHSLFSGALLFDDGAAIIGK